MSLEPVTMPFFALQIVLRAWAGTFLADKDAGRVARVAIANIFESACAGQSTTRCIYQDTLDMVGGMILFHPHLPDDSSFHFDPALPPAPTEHELNALARAYGLVWEIAYHGALTLSEIRGIAGFLRVFDLQALNDYEIEGWLHNGDAMMFAPRRAVNAFQRHDHGHELACKIVVDLVNSEVAKHEAWRQAYEAREAIAP